MQYAKIQTRIDPRLKEEAEAIFREQGIKPSQAINMFYTEVTRQRGFPFQPSHVPNDRLIKIFEEADKGIGVTSYETAEEMFEDLKNQ